MQRLPFDIRPTTTDEQWMLEALKEAWKAYQKDEVPVGAVLVQDGAVIARGHNQVELLRDATAHAEMLCITSASAELDNWRLAGCTLYCTMEPCSMCAGALLLARVDRLVWGAPDLRHGANGSWTDLLGMKHPMHDVNVTREVLAEPSADLLRSFFQKKRQEKK